MRESIAGACVILTTFLIVSPLAAQSRNAPAGSGGGRGVAAAASSTSSVSSSSVGSSPSSYSYSGAMGNRGVGYSSSPAPYVPSLSGTSFSTPALYYSWNSYYSYLNSYYRIYPFYFTRFYKNQEPLITPAMLKITLRQPLIVTKEMLTAIDELDGMLSDAREGKAVDREALAEKSKEIREYAKQIRKDRTLSIIDIRKKTDVYKEDQVDALDPEAVAQLREMALDLHRQLVNLYNVSSSSTVSVESYREPSFESVAKGIEKACKAIERSSKRL